MMNIKGKRLLESGYLLYGSIILVAVVFFVMLYGVHVLDPTYTDWLLDAEDLSQHYIGWKAYRNSKWMFPIGITDSLIYPDKISIIFTDSIPIFAVFFKILSPILTKEFQFFGLWGIMCFILQGCFSARIIKRFTDNQVFVVVSALFFMITPVMIWRMFAHTALAGHWILLLTLEPLFVYDKYSDSKRICIVSCVTGMLAASIHIYFVLMCGIIWAAFCLKDIFIQKSVKRSAFILSTYLASVCFIVGILGGFSSPTQTAAGGLGIFSYNLNALFNPQEWSCIYKDLPLYGGGQYEGFAYLGAGCIGLFLLIVALFLNRSDIETMFLKYWKKLLPFVFLAIIAVAVALSPIVTFGDRVVHEFILPDIITKIWSIFRASGRVIWIVVYVFMLSSVIALIKLMNKKMLVAALTVSVIVQVYDIHGILEEKARYYHTKIEYDSPLKADVFWNSVAENKEIKHIVLADHMLESELLTFGNWATSNYKTVNNFYIARSVQDTVSENLTDALAELSSENLYVFHDSNQLGCLMYDLNYYKADEYIIGSRKIFTGFTPMERSDFCQNVWTFGGNQYLENGGDVDDGRILNSNGLSFGPYWRVPGGNYIVTVEGKQILDKTEIIIYSQKGTYHHDFQVIDSSEDRMVMSLSLIEDDVDDLEICVRNISDVPIHLEKISLLYQDS